MTVDIHVHIQCAHLATISQLGISAENEVGHFGRGLQAKTAVRMKAACHFGKGIYFEILWNKHFEHYFGTQVGELNSL